MSNTMTRDLSRKMQTDLAAVLERNGNIANQVLGTADIGIIMVEAAVMMAHKAAATIANMSDDKSESVTLFGVTIATIVNMIEGAKDNALARTIATQMKGAC